MPVIQTAGTIKEKLIVKILESHSPLKRFRSELSKKSIDRLIDILFEQSVLAEKKFWRDDIIQEIKKLDPKRKGLEISNDKRLILLLMEMARKVNGK